MGTLRKVILLSVTVLLIAFLGGFLTLRGGVFMLATTGVLVSAASVAASILSQHSAYLTLQFTILVLLSFSVGAAGALARAYVGQRDDAEVD